MQNGIISVHDLFRRFAIIGKRLFKLFLRDIGTVVKDRAVVYDKDFIFRYCFSASQGELLFVELVGNHKILKLFHAHASGERA